MNEFPTSLVCMCSTYLEYEEINDIVQKHILPFENMQDHEPFWLELAHVRWYESNLKLKNDNEDSKVMELHSGLNSTSTDNSLATSIDTESISKVKRFKPQSARDKFMLIYNQNTPCRNGTCTFYGGAMMRHYCSTCFMSEEARNPLICTDGRMQHLYIQNFSSEIHIRKWIYKHLLQPAQLSEACALICSVCGQNSTHQLKVWANRVFIYFTKHFISGFLIDKIIQRCSKVIVEDTMFTEEIIQERLLMLLRPYCVDFGSELPLGGCLFLHLEGSGILARLTEITLPMFISAKKRTKITYELLCQMVDHIMEKALPEHPEWFQLGFIDYSRTQAYPIEKYFWDLQFRFNSESPHVLKNK